MPKLTVRQGDCVSSIALAHGFDPETIWNHPGNAELKQLRRSPNALLPGDELEVPTPELREDGVATGSVGRFKLTVPPIKLRLRLTSHGKPRADLPYELILEGEGTLTGTTDGDGWIDQPIPAAATRAMLSLDDGDESYELLLGHLDPHDSTTGIQQRLRALGYYFGRVDGEMGPQTENALRRFQDQHGLAVTGEVDDATSNALHDAYGG
jgi:N-acetylmuramoyl-L-alanine amidase